LAFSNLDSIKVDPYQHSIPWAFWQVQSVKWVKSA